MKRSAAALLALAIALVLIATSARFFFHQPYYEWWDSAANSFSVIRAKHFAQLYGPYSRWGFTHPGPALFYVEALGEWLFYDVLHLVPAPFNGQLLLHVMVMAGFFAAALQIFTHWLPARIRRWFLALAIAGAAVHFGGKDQLNSYDLFRGAPAFLSNWSAHAQVLPFLCLLTAAASVAAGRGQDLPLLVLSGGFLVHNHVALPLFVLPVGWLACIGLWRASAPRTAGGTGQFSGGAADHVPRARAVWRACPRALLLAAGLCVVFALPLAWDLSLGRDSNAAAILTHLRKHHGEHKQLVSSCFYFLQFGAYASYQPASLFLGRYDLSGALAYLRAHVLILTGWALIALLAAWASLREIWKATRHRETGDDQDAGEPENRFLAWAGAFLFLAVALTLCWGVIQDGQMFYYNAWFNFGIYYFALLIALATGCLGVDARAPHWSGSAWGRWLPVGFAAVVCLSSAGQWRVADPTRQIDDLVHDNVARAIKITAAGRSRPVCKSLVFEDVVWHYAVGVALQLARAGEPYTVPERWRVRFGLPPGGDKGAAGVIGDGVRAWRFEGEKTVPPQATSIPAFVLRDGMFLNVGEPLHETSTNHPAFFNGEAALSNRFYYLAFPGGNVFGYYTYTDFPCIYHQELGFLNFSEANDGKGGVYLYDFASSTFFYTSPDYPFPYLYDCSLHAVLYYFPDTKHPGHYTVNPRCFYNTATGKIITK